MRSIILLFLPLALLYRCSDDDCGCSPGPAAFPAIFVLEYPSGQDLLDPEYEHAFDLNDIDLWTMEEDEKKYFRTDIYPSTDDSTSYFLNSQIRGDYLWEPGSTDFYLKLGNLKTDTITLVVNSNGQTDHVRLNGALIANEGNFELSIFKDLTE